MPANTVTVTENKESVTIAAEGATVATSGTPLVNVTTAVQTVTSIIDIGMLGPAGKDDAFYQFDQGTPASTWTINHSLSKMPSITVVDSSGAQVEGDIQYISASQVKVIFSAAFSGKAYLN